MWYDFILRFFTCYFDYESNDDRRKRVLNSKEWYYYIDNLINKNIGK